MSESIQDLSFLSLADQFLHEHKLGIGCTVEEFADRYPAEREQILQYLPQVLMLDEHYQHQSNLIAEMPIKVGNYVLKQEIGRGGMGVVYSATHPSLDNDLAIKLLPIGRFRKKRNLQRFNIEARTCAAMDHPNIVPVFDYGLNEDFAFFAMRRIHGCSLAEIIRQMSSQSNEMTTSLTWREICDIGIQAASALHYAHEQGVIHRDVKPANMMLEDGKLWLTDFGLAKLRDEDSQIRNFNTELTQSGELVGTARYMAPERFRGVCSPVSDLFGLGLTLYELATGSKASKSIEMSLGFGDDLGLPDVRVINPDAPEALSQIIMKACHFDPEERYQSAAEMLYVLQRYNDGIANADRRSTRNSTRSRWFRRDVILWAVGVVTTVVGCGIYWTMSEARKQRKASIEEIAEAMDRDLLGVHSVDFLQQLSDSGPDTRVAVSKVMKDMLFDEEGLTPKSRDRISNEIDLLMDDYIKNGFDSTFLSKPKESTGSAWTLIPRLITEIERCNLDAKKKELAVVRLVLISHESAVRRLGEEQRILLDQATANLIGTRSWFDADVVFTDQELMRFIEEISEIDGLYPSLQPLNALL